MDKETTTEDSIIGKGVAGTAPRSKSRGNFFKRKSGTGSSVEDAIQAGVEARKKARNAIKKSSVQETLKYFQESIDTLKSVVLDKEQENTVEYSIALYEMGKTYFEHSLVLSKSGFSEAKAEGENQWSLLEKALDVLKRIPLESSSAESDEIAATVMFRLAQRKIETRALKEGEELLIDALERQNQAVKRKNQKSTESYTLLQNILDLLVNSEKARSKQGKATYVACGEFVKQGGNYKSWKKRFFVIDDTSIAYFKNKKDWENGPVAGNPGKPYGVIKFSEVTNVSSHGKVCPMVRPDKRPASVRNSFCFHVHTPERIYHLLSLPETPEQEYKRWPQLLTQLMQSYKEKKMAKNLLKKQQQDSGKKKGKLEASSKSEDEEEEHHSINDESSEDEDYKLDEEGGGSAIFTPSSEPQQKEPAIEIPTNENQNPSKEAPAQTQAPKISLGTEDKVLKEQTDGSTFTQSKLKAELETMSDDEAVQLLKNIFKQYESEGQLRKLMQALCSEDPKAYIQKLSNVGNFNLAKFGVLQKIGSSLQQK